MADKETDHVHAASLAQLFNNCKQPKLSSLQKWLAKGNGQLPEQSAAPSMTCMRLNQKEAD